MNAIHFFFVISFWSPIASFAGEPSLAQRSLEVSVKLASLQATLADLQKVACLTDDARNHLRKFADRTAAVKKSVEASFAAYSTAVSTPMAGNGKCDGGFRAVAIESASRRELTLEYENHLYEVQSILADGMTKEFLEPNIDMPDESEEQECADPGVKLYELVEANGLLANDAFTAFRTSAVRTGELFASYANRNEGLHDGCGSLSDGPLVAAVSGGGAPAEVPSGVSRNPASTITGEIRGENLEGGAAEPVSAGNASLARSPGARGAGTSAAGAANGAGSGSPASFTNTATEAYGEFMKTQGHRDPARAGLPLAPSVSEEMAVQSIGKGEGAGTAAGGNELVAGLLTEARSASAGSAAKEDAAKSNGAAAREAIDSSLFDRIHSALRNRAN